MNSDKQELLRLKKKVGGSFSTSSVHYQFWCTLHGNTGLQSSRWEEILRYQS